MPEESSAALKRRVRQLLYRVCPKLHDWAFNLFSKNGFVGWRKRIAETVSCPDNAFIPRVPDAGKRMEGFQIMHNGIKILQGSYYGGHLSDLLLHNKGVHEPQEERVFQEVLQRIPQGSTMLELGAYWSFYSMWFCKEVPNARCFMVEPVGENIEFGKRNFAVNGLKGNFLQAWVGRSSSVSPDGTRTIAVDDFIASSKVDSLAILHCDIQGHEMEMLLGSEMTLLRTSYVFISTHSEELHRSCEGFLNARAFVTVTSISPRDSYSVDGILVCRSKEAGSVPLLGVSRKRAGNARRV